MLFGEKIFFLSIDYKFSLDKTIKIVYIEAVKTQEMSSVDLEIEEQKILQFKDSLKILFK